MEVKKILIVEDEKPMAKAMELKLKNSGFDALAVFDGQQGYDALTKAHFDLVILDLIMPEIDGFTLLSKLKESDIKVPVIVTTNLSQEEDLTKAKELGALGYFSKSETPLSEFIQKVTAFLQK